MADGRRLSAASRVLMRRWRELFIGWVWYLLDQLALDDWVFFSVVLPGWWVNSGDLTGVSAGRLMRRLRAALYRAGAAEASGWLYAMIDIGFDGSTNGFTIHVHGVATKGMMQVVRRLRRQRQFKRNASDRTRYPNVTVAKKLQIDRPWGNLPALISYTTKSVHLQRNSLLGDDGKRRRVGREHRITGIHRIRYLLWLHRERVKDQVLLIHLAVIDGKLTPTERGDR